MNRLGSHMVLVIVLLGIASFVDCRQIQQTSETGPCPDGSYTYQCFVQPCSKPNCPNYEKVECREDYCVGCSARYYVDGVEVTQNCTTPE